MTFLYILLGILMFGALILTHEAGHFFFARLFGVTVHEFAIGMGPKLLSHTSKKGITYSLRAFPIGGFVSMAGEDEDSDDPNGIDKKPLWQRMIVVAAGALVNILTGFVLMGIISASSDIASLQIKEFYVVSEATGEWVDTDEILGLRVGDTIKKIGKRTINVSDDLLYEVMFIGDKPVDVTVKRDGEMVVIPDVSFPTYVAEGIEFGNAAFIGLETAKKTPFVVVKEAVCRGFSTIRMLFDSVIALFKGQYGTEALSGPVGVVDAVGETASYGVMAFLFFVAVIALNLGLVNLFPLPALDGGRLFFMLIELIFRRKVPAKFEAAVHTAGFVLLMGLMVFVTYQDIVKIIFR